MADVAQLTTFKYAATAVGKITSISGPSISNPTIDVSDLDDTSREKISSKLSDAGQVTLAINFEPDLVMHDHLVDECIAGNSGACIITYPDAATTTWSFTGFPAEVSPTANVGEQLTASVTLDITGAVTAS